MNKKNEKQKEIEGQYEKRKPDSGGLRLAVVLIGLVVLIVAVEMLRGK